MTRHTTPARSRGGEGVRRWVFAHGMDPDVEALVLKWLTARLDGFHCDLQVMYAPHAVGPELARTHIVLNNAPPLHAMDRADEAVEVDARGSTPRDAVEALIEATGSDPRLSVRGWPFCLDDLDGAAGGGRRDTTGTAVYIALEGPDGVGKSTVAAALKELLRKRAPAPYSAVRIRHFPTDALAACADDEGRRLKAEDYALDMENWLSFRPEPVLFPDAPTHSAAPSAKRPGTLYILDRWALSTAVYASLRNERIAEGVALTLHWLNRVPLTTFVLLPRDPSELTDPDYPGPDPYNPRKVTEGYRTFSTNAFVSGEPSGFVPIVVDRTRDTPDSVAAEIAEWIEGSM